jgi:hypothetical protein
VATIPELHPSAEEIAASVLYVKSDIYQRRRGFDWIVAHKKSDWFVAGHAKTLRLAVTAVEETLKAAIAHIDVGEEVRLFRVLDDA